MHGLSGRVDRSVRSGSNHICQKTKERDRVRRRCRRFPTGLDSRGPKRNLPSVLYDRLGLIKPKIPRVGYPQVLDSAAHLNVDGNGILVDPANVRSTWIHHDPQPHRPDLRTPKQRITGSTLRLVAPQVLQQLHCVPNAGFHPKEKRRRRSPLHPVSASLS